MRPAQLVSELKALSFEHTFNPYSQRCAIYDKADAPQLRSCTLTGLLNAALKVEVDSVWIGRDLGYRGGRRTGLALTDDVHIHDHTTRWCVPAKRPTKGAPLGERTADVIWSVLQNIELPVFLWNVFPLHPHLPDDPFTNRSHCAKERSAGEEILAALILLLCPKRIIAVGNDAAQSALRIAANIPVYQVRHPSYGGQTEFSAQVRSLYAMRPDLLSSLERGTRFSLVEPLA